MTEELKNMWVVNQNFQVTLIVDNIIKTATGSAALVIEALEKNVLISAELIGGTVVEKSFDSGYAYLHMNELPETFALQEAYYTTVSITQNRGIDTLIHVPKSNVIADVRMGAILSIKVQSTK